MSEHPDPDDEARQFVRALVGDPYRIDLAQPRSPSTPPPTPSAGNFLHGLMADADQKERWTL